MAELSVGFRIDGVEKVLARLSVSRRLAPHAAGAALYQEAEQIMGESKERYVPVDDAVLKGSGFVELPAVTATGASVTMGYGGAASAYALAIHEHLSKHSPPSWVAAEAAGRPVQFHPPDHGPKYLERPLLAALRGMAERLAARIRPKLVGGV